MSPDVHAMREAKRQEYTQQFDKDCQQKQQHRLHTQQSQHDHDKNIVKQDPWQWNKDLVARNQRSESLKAAAQAGVFDTSLAHQKVEEMKNPQRKPDFAQEKEYHRDLDVQTHERHDRESDEHHDRIVQEIHVRFSNNGLKSSQHMRNEIGTRLSQNEKGKLSPHKLHNFNKEFVMTDPPGTKRPAKVDHVDIVLKAGSKQSS
jgi:hypothetical protein